MLWLCARLILNRVPIHVRFHGPRRPATTSYDPLQPVSTRYGSSQFARLSRLSPHGSHGSVSQINAQASHGSHGSVRNVHTVRFQKSGLGLARFSQFGFRSRDSGPVRLSRFGFTSHGSHDSHGSVSRATVRIVLIVFIGLIITTDVLEVWRLCCRACSWEPAGRVRFEAKY